MGESKRARSRIRQHIENLGDPERKTSARAEALLLRHYGARAATELVEACSHENPTVRLRAGWALAHTGDPRALSTLLVLTEDADHEVRYDSTIALGIVGGPEALEQLVRLWMLEDDARPAAMALIRWGNGAFDVARGALSHPSAGIRQDAIYVLGHIHRSGAYVLIRGRLDDPDPNVRAEAQYWMDEFEARSS